MTIAVVLFVATAILVPLLINEFGELAPWLAVRLVRWTARRLGRQADADRYAEEWEANIHDVPGKLAKLAAAVSIAAYSPLLRGSLRRRRARRLSAFAPPPLRFPKSLIARTRAAKEVIHYFRKYSWRSRKSVPPVCVVAGLGGIGKTTLTSWCAQKLAKRFPGGVVWVDFRTDITELLTALGIDPAVMPSHSQEQMEALWEYTADSRLLVVLDGAEALAERGPLLLERAHCPVLVSTRDAGFASSEQKLLRLGPLDDQEATSLLCEIGPPGLTAVEVRPIAERLGGLPLAISVVAGLMKRSGKPVHYFIEELDKAERKLRGSEGGDSAK